MRARFLAAAACIVLSGALLSVRGQHNEAEAPASVLAFRSADRAGKTPRERARSALIEAIADPEPSVRLRALEALVRFQDPSIVLHLERALKDEDAGIRSWAASALGELASPHECRRGAAERGWLGASYGIRAMF